MGHLSKLQEEFGVKGLNVIALNGEAKDIHLRYMVHNDAGFRYRLAIGGGNEYGVTGIPHAYLVDPEGTVVWEGSPSSMSEKKDLLPALKMVREPTAEEIAARSAKMMKWADDLAADGLVARAEAAYEQVAKTYPKAEVADEAKTRAKAMSDDEHEAEYKAQKEIAKLVGGLEAPDPDAKKFKGKQIESIAKKLTKLSEELTESAPRASKLAAEWATIFATPWE